MVSVAKDLGIEAGLEVLADSSAAVGICRRTGIGKARHLAVGQLWAQERARGGDCALTKHPGLITRRTCSRRPRVANSYSAT